MSNLVGLEVCLFEVHLDQKDFRMDCGPDRRGELVRLLHLENRLSGVCGTSALLENEDLLVDLNVLTLALDGKSWSLCSSYPPL